MIKVGVADDDHGLAKVAAAVHGLHKLARILLPALLQKGLQSLLEGSSVKVENFDLTGFIDKEARDLMFWHGNPSQG